MGSERIAGWVSGQDQPTTCCCTHGILSHLYAGILCVWFFSYKCFWSRTALSLFNMIYVTEILTKTRDPINWVLLLISLHLIPDCCTFFYIPLNCHSSLPSFPRPKTACGYLSALTKEKSRKQTYQWNSACMFLLADTQTSKLELDSPCFWT